LSGACPVLPDRLRDIESTLLVADYSSLEVGIQGDLCKRLFNDDQLIQKYIDQDKKGKNIDIHSSNAREVFGRWLGWTIPATVMVEGKPVLCQWAGERVDVIPVQEFKKHPYGEKLRGMIKEIWYGLAYGKGAYGFSTLIGPDGKMIGEDRAQQMVDALLDAVPGMRKWMVWVEEFIREYLGIYSLGGRWCDLAELIESGEEWMFRRALRRALNFPMQASGAEIIGEAMVAIDRCAELLELGYRIFLQVHDELVLRGPLKHLARASELVLNYMTSATANGTRLLVPLQVGIGHGENYYVAK
jgi:DNA polymerase-1